MLLPGQPIVDGAQTLAGDVQRAEVGVDGDWQPVLDAQLTSPAAHAVADEQLVGTVTFGVADAVPDPAAAAPALVAAMAPDGEVSATTVTPVAHPRRGLQYDVTATLDGYPTDGATGAVRARVVVDGGRIYVLATFGRGTNDPGPLQRLVTGFEWDVVPAGSACPPAEVGPDLDLDQPGRRGQPLRRIGLAGVERDDQRTAVDEPVGRAGDDRAQVVEPIGPGEEGDVGLPVERLGRAAHRWWRRRAGSRPPRRRRPGVVLGKGIEPRPLDQPDASAGSAEGSGVGPGHDDGVGRALGQPHLGARALDADRQPDGTRPGAEVAHDGRSVTPTQAVDLLQHHRHHLLGLGSRDQDAAVDGRVQGRAARRRRGAAAVSSPAASELARCTRTVGASAVAGTSCSSSCTISASPSSSSIRRTSIRAGVRGGATAAPGRSWDTIPASFGVLHRLSLWLAMTAEHTA